ncbi:hypothetical protein FZ103_14235 [Streptomonospora sp. PA3]|uniref:divisome protein SepX/GlpR n=1 Tax=Streptomonospora sp. PA3 TaxID=2607326 RepID=UPI0012DFB398|nr:hypothetical protein [Streptomonospora sp. PA3]MUL42325.1 hypothetical protein [Streptomonospora sp. PA3]
MSSSPLYLAIVVVWLIVLVPMLLRRDAAVDHEDGAELDADLDADLGADPDADAAEDADGDPAANDADPADTERTGTGAGAPEGRGDAVPEADSMERSAPVREPEEDSEYEETAVYSAAPPPRPRVSRAKVIARRRRRTFGLTALLVLSGAGVAAGLGPWWVLAPPAVLLAGHLVLLREAAKADAERRAAEARRRRRLAELRRAREEARAAREAQVIELMERRNQVYDQYTDAHQRAAGD